MRIKNLTDKEYQFKQYIDEFGFWWEDNWSKHKSGIHQFKYRMYRTWKYNRKTQYKIK